MSKQERKTIAVRVDRCVGCRSCELACALAHSASGSFEQAVEFGEKPGYRVNVEACGPSAVPVHCNHCEDAACVMVCPTGAVHRDEKTGHVLVDEERCIGCRMCVQACPFGVIATRPDGKGVLKCDMCVARLAKGAQPACVEACPTQALVFGSEEEMVREKRRRTAEKMVMAREEADKQ